MESNVENVDIVIEEGQGSSQSSIEKVRCRICNKSLGRITNSHLKSHNILVDEYKKMFPDSLIIPYTLSKLISERLKETYKKGERQPVRMFGKDNPMSNPEIKIKHKKSVQKKNRPFWRLHSSQSLKGRRVGGASIEGRKKVSKTIKEMWTDPNSVYNSEQYRKKLCSRKFDKTSKGQIEFFNFVKSMFPDTVMNHKVDVGKLYRSIDVFIPSKNIGFEWMGCYWHGCPKHFPKLIERWNKTMIRYQDIILKTGIHLFPIWECMLKDKKEKMYYVKLILDLDLNGGRLNV